MFGPRCAECGRHLLDEPVDSRFRVQVGSKPCSRHNGEYELNITVYLGAIWDSFFPNCEDIKVNAYENSITIIDPNSFSWYEVPGGLKNVIREDYRKPGLHIVDIVIRTRRAMKNNIDYPVEISALKKGFIKICFPD